MTLHQLRLAVGDETLFRILQRWTQRYEGGLVTTAKFIRLAERESGQDLDALFETWLFTPGRPAVAAPEAAAARTLLAPADDVPAAAPNLRGRFTVDLLLK